MVLKNKIQSNFTMIPNVVLIGKNLSNNDRGLLCALYGLPDGWNLTIRGLAAIMIDGESSIAAGLKRLEKAGYIKRYRARNAEGQLGQTVYELIIPENAETLVNTELYPKRENHVVASPNLESGPQYNTENNKNIDDDDTRTRVDETSTIKSASEIQDEPDNPLIDSILEALENPAPESDPHSQAEIIASRIRRQQAAGSKIVNVRRYIQACLANNKAPARRPERQRKPQATKKNKFNNFSGRQYDATKLERMLLGGGGGNGYRL